MNHKWNYQPITPEQAETSQTLAQELGISPILGQLLVQRGITKLEFIINLEDVYNKR